MTATTLKPEVPGPKPKLPFTILLKMQRDRIKFFQELNREYGDVAKFNIGPVNVFLINHPDYIRDMLVTNNRNFHKGRGLEKAKRMLGEGLLTSEDEFHRRQRRLVQPAFHRQRIAAYADTMSAYARRAGER